MARRLPPVGSPDDVADEIERFHRPGCAGTTVSFVDHVGELDSFAQEVLPRLEARRCVGPRRDRSGPRE